MKYSVCCKKYAEDFYTKYKNNFSADYGKILEPLQQIKRKKNFLNQKCKPELSDIESKAIDLTSEY